MRVRPRPPHLRPRLTLTAATAALSLLALPTAASAASAPAAASPLRPQVAYAGTPATATTALTSTSTSASAHLTRPARPSPLDHQALERSLQAFHDAGMYGAYSAVRDGSDSWQGAAGVADIDTGRPVTPQMQHRIGSITKTFTAVAVLREVSKGRIDLDAPIDRYLPDLITGERGRAVTVRMLLNHTSGIADYSASIFATMDSLEGNRFHQFAPEELARLGIEAPPFGKPGQAHHYSNTNYIIAGLLLQKVTGQVPETYITAHVIRKAGLRHTYFPQSPSLSGPHAKMYEAANGHFDPPRDFSVYNMSWAGTAGALVSTMPDLNRFYRSLLGGELLPWAQLRQMKTTVPIPGSTTRYGLGLFQTTSPCGEFWGHSGLVVGAMTWSWSSPDGRRQISLGFNLTRYQKLDSNDLPLPNPIDAAMDAHVAQAICSTTASHTTERPLAPTRTAPLASAPGQHSR
ncbi:serine hydrolase domain-containing protein [Streptomyces sp. 769]|uniref:serine hydrolase domain-containing protein n=1 Tax=Streptomyces sp. 769 TaxID=1262452 RepID=UPI000581B9EA|nr:serine hydrolase domain-containing protein [Streptomyces sp. 769]AJC60915.1 alkaline D-peptidase [Streptomyces sp. 769]